MKKTLFLTIILSLIVNKIKPGSIKEKCQELSEINKNSEVMFKSPTFISAFNSSPLIGEGNFGKVKLLNYYLDNQLKPLTIPNKIVSKFQYISDLSDPEINNEITLLKAFKDTEEVVNYYNCYYTENPQKEKTKGPYLVFILTEYLPGTLGDQREEFNKLSQTQRITHYINLLKSLKIFHINNLLHLDIKLANIMSTSEINIKNNFSLKYIDLGLVRKIGDKGNKLGSPNYMCPDLFGDIVTLKAKFDIYSLIAVIANLEYGVKLDGNCVQKWNQGDCTSRKLVEEVYDSYVRIFHFVRDDYVFEEVFKNVEKCGDLICFVIKYLRNDGSLDYDLENIVNELENISASVDMII